MTKSYFPVLWSIISIICHYFNSLLITAHINDQDLVNVTIFFSVMIASIIKYIAKKDTNGNYGN